ncbi:MAG: SUMF1/EgtB/PvdO family nonheme iron enzyme, partial [Anaerolineae bacterium]|nr:SUMF1/EgtB/PvdO family nonheme iron enzyme [Anaerolineae bacterium]
EASGLNPQGPVAGTNRVVRGGSWDAVPFFARTVHRQEYAPNTQTLYIGFRCVSDDVPVQSGESTSGEGAAAQPDATTGPTPTLPPGG